MPCVYNYLTLFFNVPRCKRRIVKEVFGTGQQSVILLAAGIRQCDAPDAVSVEELFRLLHAVRYAGEKNTVLSRIKLCNFAEQRKNIACQIFAVFGLKQHDIILDLFVIIELYIGCLEHGFFCSGEHILDLDRNPPLPENKPKLFLQIRFDLRR